MEGIANFLTADHQMVTTKHQEDKVVVFERGDAIFVFNFHHTNSYQGYRVPCYSENEHFYLIDTDDAYFGGHNRIVPNIEKFPVIPQKGEFNPFTPPSDE